MGITNLLQDNGLSEDEKTFLLENIMISSNELDTIIKEIVLKSESIRANEE
jgi:hypothetical protein